MAAPPTTPGSTTVMRTLGLPPRQLHGLHAPGTPAEALAALVAAAARNLDDVHRQLVSEALRASDTLRRTVTGETRINSLGILQHTGIKIDILAARREDAVHHLNATIHTYQQATSTDNSPPRSTAAPTVPAPTPPVARGR